MATIYSGSGDRNKLELFYDVRNKKSFKGEPTVNLNTSTLSDSGTDGSGQGSVGTRTILSPNHVRIVDVNSNTRQNHLITGLTGGTIYTISVEYKKLTGTPTFRFQIQDHNGGTFLRNIKFTDTEEIGIEDKEGWQRAIWTFTLGADANAVRIWYQDGADYTTYTHSFELRNPQLEQNNHATPFVEGTRAEFLGDLTGNNTLDISNVSYNENGDILFNGTSDSIKTGNFSLDFGAGSFTLEAWVYPFVNNDYDKIINKGQSGAFPAPDTDKGYSLRFMNSGATLSVGDGTNFLSTTVQNVNDVPVNKWSHIVGVVNRKTGEQYLYINGELNNSGTINYGDISIPSAELTIGSLDRGIYGANGEYFSGMIPMVRIYSRALSAAEVTRNFKSSFERIRLEEPGIVQSAPTVVTPPPPPPAGTNDNYLLGLQDRDYLAGNVPGHVGALNWSTTPITISFWISPDWETGLDMPITGYQSADRLNTFWIAWNNKNSGFFARFITDNQLKASWRQRWWNPYRSSAVTGVSAANGVWSKRNLGNTVTYGNREWIHIVLTHDPNQSVISGGMDLYWNGQKLTSTFANRNGVSPNWTSDNFALGAIYSPLYRNNEVPFEQTVEGGLDQYKLYDRKLTEPEITALFNAGISDTNSLYGPIYEVDCESGANPELSLNQTATFQQH